MIKSTVISHCCFDLLKKEDFPILIAAPTNVMIDSILSKIDFILQRLKIQLPRGFIIRHGNIANLIRTYPHLTKYAFDNIVEDSYSSCCSNGSKNSFNKITIAKDFFQNARIILTTSISFPRSLEL